MNVASLKLQKMRKTKKQIIMNHYEYTRVTGGKTSLSHGRLTGELQRMHQSHCKLSYLDQITLQDET